MQLLAGSSTWETQNTFAGVVWAERLIIGPLGTTLAIIAVAWFGFAMLGGRLPLKRGGLMVVGCFILFSAPMMARALLGLAQQTGGGAGNTQPQEFVVASTPVAPSPPAPTNANPFDPYAGAAVPSN